MMAENDLKRLLVVAHAPSDNTKAMLQAVVDGARSAEAERLDIVAQSPFDTVPAHVLAAKGVILGTTENLGYMSGALKDFFDRCYYPLLDRTEAMPYAAYIRGRHDGTGTRRGIETIVRGLRWKAVREPLICQGAWRADFLEECHELGAQMAAGIDAGIY